MKKLRLMVILEREDDPLAGYSAYCPSLPGCSSNGFTYEDALINARKAIKQHLEMLLDQRQVIPLDTNDIRIETLDLLLAL